MGDMMQIYFQLGFDHILDLEGYDHMLFLLALCIPFTIKDWKKVLILATAFTVGHSVTLIFSTLEIISFPTKWVEFFIPITIIIAALFDLFRKQGGKLSLHYFLAFGFGLIHGMGFSNFLRSSLFPGEESKLVWQLLSFNIGIEIGQIIIIAVIISIFWGLSKVLDKWNLWKRPGYQVVFSIMVIVWALWMAIERVPS